MIVLDFDIVAVFVEDLGKLAGNLACPSRVAALNGLIDLAAEAAGEAEDPFVEFVEEFSINPRLVIITLSVGLGH